VPSASADRAAQTTLAPAAAKARAVARPIPLEAPVMTTTCSATGWGMSWPVPVAEPF
jgi:hypothetical protein